MLKLRKKNFILLLIGIFLAGTLFAIGVAYVVLNISGTSLVSNAQYDRLKQFATDYKTLYQVDSYINEKFYWDRDISKTRDEICEEIVKSLDDPYSIYMDEKEYKDFVEYMSGKFCGVGISYAQRDKDFVVIKAIKNSPAEAAGFTEGDIIKRVDGKAYKTSDQVQAALKGEKGTPVSIEYERDGKMMKCTIIRDEIVVESVMSQVIEGDIGYIGISAFERDTAEQFEVELAELEKKELKGLVIDLRSNGGGYLTECLEVADALLPACTLTKTVDKNGKTNTFESKSSCTDLPYVVLVNGGTASASEVLAGAIQDNKGGKIVGTRTFGKGIVQSSFPLNNGGCLNLTTMEYLTPDDHKVHKKGITPDYVVELDKDATKDYQLLKAIKLLKTNQ